MSKDEEYPFICPHCKHVHPGETAVDEWLRFLRLGRCGACLG